MALMQEKWFAGLATRAHLDRCVIAMVAENSPAYKAGLRVGDEITEVDYCPVTPDTVVQKYGEVRTAPCPQVVFTIRRNDGSTEEVVVVREPMDRVHAQQLSRLHRFDSVQGKPAPTSWQIASRTLQDGRTHCFVVGVDVGFDIAAFPEVHAALKKATGSWYTATLSFENNFPYGPCEDNTLFCIVARALLTDEGSTTKVAAAMFLGPLTPAQLQPFSWETACVRVGRETTWHSMNLKATLDSVGLRLREPGRNDMLPLTTLCEAIASAFAATGNGHVIDETATGGVVPARRGALPI